MTGPDDGDKRIWYLLGTAAIGCAGIFVILMILPDLWSDPEVQRHLVLREHLGAALQSVRIYESTYPVERQVEIVPAAGVSAARARAMLEVAADLVYAREKRHQVVRAFVPGNRWQGEFVGPVVRRRQLVPAEKLRRRPATPGPGESGAPGRGD